MAPKIAIVFYSTWGHVKQLAEAEAQGIEEAGGSRDLYQIQETLSGEVLQKMYAPAKDSNIPILDSPKTLEQYDGFLFGIPTRYGNFPAQWRTFWGRTGGQWQNGYKTAAAILSDLSEVRGGSPWGAGTFSAGDGSRRPSEKELELAREQGKAFYGIVSKVT